MSQNIYDNQKFFDGYATLPRSQFGLAGAPEWSDIEAILPNLNGSKIIDLGCGYGWFCRYVKEKGASKVLGIDLSQKMIERARKLTDDKSIQYEIGDLEKLNLSEKNCDLIYSSLTLHYLPQLTSLFKEVNRALCDEGSFIFTMEHPIFTCSTKQRWIVDETKEKFWGVNNYQKEGKRVTNWFADGVVKFHRTLGTVLNELIQAGFKITHINEWGPSDSQLNEVKELSDEIHRPMIVIISAQKLGVK